MKTKKLINGKVLTISYFDPGEEVTICHTICADKFKQFLEENINDDVDVMFEDLENDFKMNVFTQTIEESREAEIQGTIWGEGCSRESAIRIVDGLEPLSEEQEEAALEKQIAEAMK